MDIGAISIRPCDMLCVRLGSFLNHRDLGDWSLRFRGTNIMSKKYLASIWAFETERALSGAPEK